MKAECSRPLNYGAKKMVETKVIETLNLPRARRMLCHLSYIPILVPALGIEPSSEVFLGLPALGFLSFKDTYYFTSRWFLMLPITETKPLHRHVCFAGITSKYTISTYKSISEMVDLVGNAPTSCDYQSHALLLSYRSIMWRTRRISKSRHAD